MNVLIRDYLYYSAISWVCKQLFQVYNFCQPFFLAISYLFCPEIGVLYHRFEVMMSNGSSDLAPPGVMPLSMEYQSDVLPEFSSFEAFDPATCSWPTYVERLQNHFELYDVPDNKRVRILIDRIGNAIYEQLRKLCAPDNPLTKTSHELLELLSRYFQPPANKFKERIKFHRRVMRADETLQEYAAELRQAAQNCEFPADWLSDALRTQFTHGIRNNFLRGKLYELEEVDFDKVLEFATSVELPKPPQPPPAPKKENPTLPNPQKPAKVAKKLPTPPALKQQPPAKKRVPPPRLKNPNTNVLKFRTPFTQSRPQFKNNPSWQDYDNGYGGSFFGKPFGNDHSKSNSSQRYVESTYMPNNSLFYRRGP